MTVQLLLVGLLLFLFIGYMGTMFVVKRKARNKIFEQRVEERSMMEEQNETAIHVWNEELFLEREDRTSWYKLTLFFENDSSKEYDFYSYNDNLTKEFILKDRFYVNDHELLIIDETGEHYINRKNIKQIDFLQRKLFVDSVFDEEKNGKNENTSQNHQLEKSISDTEPINTTVSPVETRVDLETDGPTASPKKPRFSKVKKVKRPSIKKMESKKFNRLFLIVFLSFLASGMIALIRTVVFESRIDRLELYQEKQTRQESGPGLSKITEYPYQLNIFMQTFIAHYIPLSNDSLLMEQRVEKLNEFFSEGISVDREVSTVKRTLISSELADIDHGEDHSTVCYKISYSLEIPVEQTRELESSGVVETYVDYQMKEQVAFLTIDFLQADTSFSIISYPYFRDRPLNHFETAAVRKKEDASLAVDGERLASIKQFLMIFFEKYASGSKEELAYLMSDVESMGMGYQLEAIQTVDAYDSEGSIVVYAEVKFKESESGLAHKEVFSIKLTEEENQFKVSALTHNLGGF